MTKIPIFLDPVNPLPDDLDAWAERVAELFEAAITAIEAQDAPSDSLKVIADQSAVYQI